jgi:hypothetical protein
VLTACFVYDLEIVEQRFEDWKEMSESSDGGRFSWILQVVPRGATDIHVCNDIDTGQLWLAYNHPSKSLQLPSISCEVIPPGEVIPSRHRPGHKTSWWRDGYSKISAPGATPQYHRCRRQIPYESGRIEEIVGFLVRRDDSDTVLYWEN